MPVMPELKQPEARGSSLDAWAPSSASTAGVLGSRLTVVVNTSPCAAQPSTRLLEEVIASLLVHAPALAGCRLLLVADGCKLRERYAWKQGNVTAVEADAYARYLASVQRLSKTPGTPLHGAQLLQLLEHHGCGHALRRGLARVSTPYVLVVQHDRPLCCPVHLPPLIDALDADETANTMHLPTAATLMYAVKASSRGLSGNLFDPVLVGGTVSCTPLSAFLDSTHIGRVSWYRERVFGRQRLVHLPRGCFLEDTYGQAQLADVRAASAGGVEEGREALLRHGCFLVNGFATPVVAHLDGHDALTRQEGWKKWRLAHCHSKHEADDLEASRERLSPESAMPPETLVAGFFDAVMEEVCV